jgi:CheY-like chemotaxis protein
LIVDDDECTRSIIGADLRLHGHPVFLASTGSAALRDVERCSPRAVLIDGHLDDIGGLELLRAIRQRPLVKPPAVALFTADWSLFDQSDEVQALGAAIASKLCDVDQVRELVIHLCHREGASRLGAHPFPRPATPLTAFGSG